jgi:hypothetical protein
VSRDTATSPDTGISSLRTARLAAAVFVSVASASTTGVSSPPGRPAPTGNSTPVVVGCAAAAGLSDTMLGVEAAVVSASAGTDAEPSGDSFVAGTVASALVGTVAGAAAVGGAAAFTAGGAGALTSTGAEGAPEDGGTATAVEVVTPAGAGRAATVAGSTTAGSGGAGAGVGLGGETGPRGGSRLSGSTYPCGSEATRTPM